LVNLGSVSTIDGRSLTITTGTEIENAYGGDGNDTVIGNSLANVLYGMRGDDRLDGGEGKTSPWKLMLNFSQ
jgi:Ca2+-binding RTX toxin-like protein